MITNQFKNILAVNKKMSVLTEFKQFLSGKDPQQRMLDRAGDDECFIIFQKPIGNNKFTRSFSSFININVFLNYYNSQVDDEKRYYEMIHDTCPEYFDLDYKMENWEGETKHEKIKNCVNEFLRVRNDFSYQNDINACTYKYNDLVILESCGVNSKGIDKLSLHIIMRPELNGRSKIFFKNCREQKIFQQKFSDYLKTIDTKIFIDTSVYNRRSQMRLKGSHKENETHRNFKAVTKNLDEKYYFCSYVGAILGDFPLDVIPVKSEDDVVFDNADDLDLSNNEVKSIFDNINSGRWEEYESWRTLIWLGLKLGLTDGDIHQYSSDATNYCEESTTRMINEYSPEKCKMSLGTLFYYLEKDVDPKKYKKLVSPYILDKITDKKIDALINTTGAIIKDDKWVLPEIFDGSKCTVVKAGLGKGKTTASVSHINNNDYERIIVLTPRRSFAKSVCNRLNYETKHDFVIYSNLKGKNYNITQPYVVIQVESLNRLDLDNRKTLLLCDEVESILFQMTVTKTHGQKHVQNLERFERLFKSAYKIICLDAFISNRTLNTLQTMNIDYTFYNYTLPLEKRTCFTVQ
jgi:hypothetical protein